MENCNSVVAGRWLHQYEEYFCSKCGYASGDVMYIDPLWHYTHYRYCPNCGARMTEIEEVK